MFHFNPHGPAEFGMVAELHRAVHSETDAENGPVEESRPHPFAFPFRLLAEWWRGRAPFQPRIVNFEDDSCSPAETC